ncbi:MAG TPA: thioredoxin domain-containing protein [Pyrinomonadaceae bacterium]
MKRAIPFVIIILVLGAGILVFLYFRRSASETQPPLLASASPAQNSASPANQAEPGAEPPHALGNSNAPVTLEEFGDFECPPCGMLHPILKNLEGQFGQAKLRIIFREFPLVPTHQHALAAARAAEAAGLQGKFWEMHDMIYENQNTWHGAFDVRPIFEGYATKIGLDLVQFRQDNSNEVVEQRIFLDGKRGHSLGVTGTPTVFLNGRELPFESLAPDKLKALIEAELAAHQ